MNALKLWMAQASAQQIKDLAAGAGTSVGTLQQIAGGYRTEGKASTGPTLARLIELAAEQIPVAVPLSRGDLCSACAACEHFQSCKK